ncbi:MAG TPA: acyl-CoA dehydrogenase family protein [Streptosporangiaceae bacterium]|nr:acyl-CoA dehydrogenase family protein [Streptosporangiaceae bacterium]
MRFTPQDEEFRAEVRAWLSASLTGEFAGLRGAGGPGREHERHEERLAWNRHLAAAGWTALGWPAEFGGRGASLARQVIFHEEYARAGAPARVSLVGEELLAPTLIAFGTPEQHQRFLPPIKAVTELWCQGYSEPGAGSDLANVATKATLDGNEWVITGQKIWTSLAHVADWCFVLARTAPGSTRSNGLSYLLVPMRQPGVTVRPIRQLTGTSEFNEVFFDGARTAAAHVVGRPGDGWKVAKATLALERGAAMLGLQVGFRRDLDRLLEAARQTGAATDPLLRDKLARAWIGLEAVRAYALDTLGGGDPTQASVLKILWSRWHQRLGELAMEVLGAPSMVAQNDLDDWQRLFLFTRAETIYGGSDEIQRNIIATRALGLPRPQNP